MASLNERDAARNGMGYTYHGTSQSRDERGSAQQSQGERGGSEQRGSEYTSNRQALPSASVPVILTGMPSDPNFNALSIAKAFVACIERGMAPDTVAEEAMEYAIARGAVHIRIHLDDDAGHKLQWSRSTPRPLDHPDARRDDGAHRSTSFRQRVAITLWIDKSDAPRSQSPSSGYAPTTDSRAPDTRLAARTPAMPQADMPLCSVIRTVTEPSVAAVQELIDALPEWAQEQRVTDVKRMAWKATATTPQDLMNFLEHYTPAAITVQTSARHVAFDPLKNYAVIGRFPSGAIRTLGNLDIDTNGQGKVNAFGYWSLIDPDDTALDPDKTCVIHSTIDFLAVEVI